MRTKQIMLNQKGFSIIEILIALVLISLTFTMVDFGGGDDRKKLEAAIEDISRAVGFAKNEAILKNKISRLKFDLSKTPVTYTVEISDNSDLLLPEYSDENNDLSEEQIDKKNEKIEKGFIPVTEFEENTRAIEEDILITGIATSLTKDLKTDGNAAIYFYPTGFNDEAFISFASYEEIITLEVESVRERYNQEFYPLGEFQDDQYENLLSTKTAEIFEKWSKNLIKQ